MIQFYLSHSIHLQKNIYTLYINNKISQNMYLSHDNKMPFA